MYEQRLARLTEMQGAAHIDCVALVPGPNLAYLTGLKLSQSERPIVAFFPLGDGPAVLLPGFEQGRVEIQTDGRAALFPYADEDGYAVAFYTVAEALALNGKRVAVEDLHMRVLELHALQGAAPRAQIASWERTFSGLRAVKDPSEVAAMKEAISITERALQSLVAGPLIGMTEQEVSARLREGMMEEGADGVAFIIAVAGPNGTDPHALPSDRVLQAGDLLTIDCGAIVDGYPADITRTFALGEPGRPLVDLYEAVRQANAAGKAAVKPGAAAQEVDRAARQVLIDAGFGQWFTHRAGHGLGLEVHEPPYIVEGNLQALKPGMVFTVEPGAYVPGLGGVRIEDDVLVTETGGESLTTFPRQLMTLS